MSRYHYQTITAKPNNFYPQYICDLSKIYNFIHIHISLSEIFRKREMQNSIAIKMIHIDNTHDKKHEKISTLKLVLLNGNKNYILFYFMAKCK